MTFDAADADDADSSAVAAYFTCAARTAHAADAADNVTAACVPLYPSSCGFSISNHERCTWCVQTGQYLIVVSTSYGDAALRTARCCNCTRPSMGTKP
jgi:hypothetical protein